MLEVQLRLSSEKMNCLYERLREVMLIDENWSPAGWDKRQVTKDPTGKLRKRAQQKLKDPSEWLDGIGAVESNNVKIPVDDIPF